MSCGETWTCHYSRSYVDGEDHMGLGGIGKKWDDDFVVEPPQKKKKEGKQTMGQKIDAKKETEEEEKLECFPEFSQYTPIPQPELRRDFRGRNQLPAASVAVIDRFLDNQRMDGVSVLVPTEDGKGAYVGPEELRALLFGQELDACIIDMFYFFLERRQAEAPEEYFDCHCITAYGKGYIMGWKDPKDKPKQIEYMNRMIQAIRPPIEKRQLIFSAMHFVNHWVLLVINLVEKSYEVSDSLKQHPKVDLQDYVCLLKDGLYDQLGFDTRKWPLITETKFPQQGAGDDCALFVCKAMECMSHKLTVGFPFGQEDMDLFRAKLALEFIEEMNRRNAEIAPVPPPDIPSS